MAVREIEVACPCCSSRIWVDVSTGKVVRTRRPQETDEAGRILISDKDWESVRDRVRKRPEEGQGKLEAALDRERNKADTLDELFTKAKEKARRREEEEDG